MGWCGWLARVRTTGVSRGAFLAQRPARTLRFWALDLASIEERW